MKKRKFAEGGATVAGPSSGAGSPSAGGRRPTSADALRYLRATGNKAGADEILKAAVGKPAKMPEDYGSAFEKGPLSPEQAAYAKQGRGVAPNIGPTAPPRAPTAAETAQLTRAGSSSAPQMDYVPGPGGTKIPISGGNRGVTPLPTPGLIGMPQPTPEEIAAGKAEYARKAASNPGAVSSPTMRTPVRPTAPMQMMKAGGKAKGYASGGSVKGAGIAQRGVRKCKMV